MRAHLRSLELHPDPATLSGDAKDFVLLARMIVAPAADTGEELFDVTVCTGEWLAEQVRAHDGIYNARHHVVVSLETFDQRALRAWLAARVEEIDAPTWSELAARLGRVAHWEFEDYIP
ncbi:MAG: immunity 8 family protein [Actinomycetota bacterium]|nr:immunity 8 family protein [Actinomycetota bacterium]